MFCDSVAEALIGWELRNPDGEGRKDSTTVKRAIEIMLPIKNFANQSSLTSGLGFRLGEGMVILLAVLISWIYLQTI
jgi:hypothetical protein